MTQPVLNDKDDNIHKIKQSSSEKWKKQAENKQKSYTAMKSRNLSTIIK